MMHLEIDEDLRDSFLECVNRAYGGRTEEGIYDLMRIYVERAKGAPRQSQIREKLKDFVFAEGVTAGLSSLEIEKIMLGKTDEEIERARLDRLGCRCTPA